MRYTTIIVFLCVMLATNALSYSVTKAEDDTGESKEKTEEVKQTSIFSTLYTDRYGDLNEDEAHYMLDIVPLNQEQMKAEETKSWWQTGWSYVSGAALKEATMGQLYEAINILNNYAFQFNIGSTNFMLSVLNLSYDFDLIDQLIEKLQAIMQEVTGISNTRFGSSGLFGNFAGIIAVLSIAYACYLYVWKRATTEMIGEIMKTVLTFAVALLLFSNYSSFLTGVNQVTTEASQLVLSGSINSSSEEANDRGESSGDLNENTLRERMMDNIWTLFVDRPYLFMQYGTDKVDDIGNERVQALLKKEPGDDRLQYVRNEEVKKNGNIMMTYGSVMERAVFTPLYLLVNGLCSIPIFLLALLLLVFQFWFMGIAAVAPFALLFAAIPGQFGVLKKYFVELGLPLVLKIVVSFGAIVVFAISEIMYSLNNIAVGGASEYIIVCVLQFILLALMFLLRNRIKNIFSAGSKEFQALRAEVGSLQEAVTRPVKTGVQGTAAVAGAVVGGVVSGGAGIAAGANIGSKVGQIATGEGNIQSITSGISQAQLLVQLHEKHAAKETLNKQNQQKDDADQPGYSSPISEPAFLERDKKYDEEDNSPKESFKHQEDLPAEEIKNAEWSQPQEKENQPVQIPPHNKPPEESEGRAHSNDQDDDLYANLVSLQEHMPSKQGEKGDEPALDFNNGQMDTQPAEKMKDVMVYLDIDDTNHPLPAERQEGHPVPYPLGNEETDKAHAGSAELGAGPEDGQESYRDPNDTVEKEPEDELYHLKQDNKKDD